MRKSVNGDRQIGKNIGIYKIISKSNTSVYFLLIYFIFRVIII